jgi:hypothetical protein
MLSLLALLETAKPEEIILGLRMEGTFLNTQVMVSILAANNSWRNRFKLSTTGCLVPFFMIQSVDDCFYSFSWLCIKPAPIITAQDSSQSQLFAADGLTDDPASVRCRAPRHTSSDS